MLANHDKAPLIESRDDLVAEISKGEKPKSEWRIGSEHEKIPFYRDTLRPVPYEGDLGISALLHGLAERFGWQPVYDLDKVIALEAPADHAGGSITLEPGGQFELSGAPLKTLFETSEEVGRHLEQVQEIADPLGISFLALGFSPLWTIAETPRMPKSRYKIMTEYMPKVGRYGLDMMYRTATVQVNLDFASEADMVKKMRVSLALQPIATALFANSPFTDGKPNGYLSFRSAIWLDTDNARAGMLPFAFEDGMGYERYVDYALDVPMYFVRRDHKYIDAAGQSFRAFLEGKLPQLPGEKPTVEDWADHLTTIFPEVRLKRFLEMRGADSGPWHATLCVLPALWAGLLYDQSALDAAWDLVKDWTDEERQQLRDDVPRLGLATPFRGGTLRELASATVRIAEAGLTSRAREHGFRDESPFLKPLHDILESGLTQADVLLRRYHLEWGGDVRPVFTENAY
ncbi:glutamate--cysteine ligase [Rhodomicrobium sp. Az07]|uniref:glutamate--cysteine ligase n=1 Tax=Rhodomicrobium sp. Az07 TaxID=2839034 RepID=UPI001BE773CD|nr:glutamate--cysteine ligase [Rhodomicrobium sp. Az07]MBT3070599.1 glutamate--cysteine ligase [Rhodomicrobium sp. Az07]